jgi:hypothetical protein
MMSTRALWRIGSAAARVLVPSRRCAAADRDDLVDYIGRAKQDGRLKNVVLVHGEPEPQAALAGLLGESVSAMCASSLTVLASSRVLAGAPMAVSRFERCGRVYELASSRRPEDTRAPLHLDLEVATRLLTARMGDAGRMRDFRELLAAVWVGAGGVSRMTDGEVVKSLATGIAMRRLRVFVAPVRRRASAAVVAPAEQAFEDALGPASVPAVEQPLDIDGIDRIDVAAQGVALRRAAVDGVPFCEECEKARRAQSAGAARGS